MRVSIVSPTQAFLLDYTDEELRLLRKELTYTNTSVKHLIKRHNGQHLWKTRNPDSWQDHLDALNADLKKCLVFEEVNPYFPEDVKYYIRPGSIPYLTDFNLQVENHINYPAFRKTPWKNPLPFTLHPEQETSWQEFVKEKHANVNLCTGFGKSAILLKICRETGLNTCIVVPSKSIFEELLDSFEHHFGKKYIGAFGNGKKKLGKKITIAIGDSLANIEVGSEEHEFFSNLEMLLVDESHEFAAESLEAVCHGVLAPIPYRFFASATQIRNDGTGPLLQSIIGRTVCTLTTAEAVSKGYICPHEFRIVSVDSSNPSDEESKESSDPLAQKRRHFLDNRNIAAFSAKLANAMAAQGRGTLILVEELSQIAMVTSMLKVPFAIAHSEKRKDRLEEIGIPKVDSKESVEKFNKGEVKVIVGTSCIATGTNIYPCHNVVNWRGGSSPIRTKQGGVGRAVRHGHSNPWASKCHPKTLATIWDFNVLDNFTMTRHLEARIECYLESGPNLIRYIRLKT